MQELWELLTSAQETIGGIPTKFLEQRGCRFEGEGEREEEGERIEGERERERGVMKVEEEKDVCLSVYDLVFVLSFDLL